MRRLLRNCLLIQAYLLLGLALLGSPVAWGASWGASQIIETKESKGKIKIGGKIKEIPAFHLTQENCIFVEAEHQPEEWTNIAYKQPECITLRKQRAEAKGGTPIINDTKLLRVPANQYFKVHMTVSSKMANRAGELFGFQIVRGGKTVFTQGGWKPGDAKYTKAIKLSEGRYFWRCPQNPTVWYGMIAGNPT